MGFSIVTSVDSYDLHGYSLPLTLSIPPVLLLAFAPGDSPAIQQPAAIEQPHDSKRSFHRQIPASIGLGIFRQ
jgi:hypothetical protein